MVPHVLLKWVFWPCQAPAKPSAKQDEESSEEESEEDSEEEESDDEEEEVRLATTQSVKLIAF